MWQIASLQISMFQNVKCVVLTETVDVQKQCLNVLQGYPLAWKKKSFRILHSSMGKILRGRSFNNVLALITQKQHYRNSFLEFFFILSERLLSIFNQQVSISLQLCQGLFMCAHLCRHLKSWQWLCIPIDTSNKFELVDSWHFSRPLQPQLIWGGGLGEQRCSSTYDGVTS